MEVDSDLPQIISTSLAPPSMPAAVMESAVEKLFFVEGRKKRAAKNPAKPPVKKGKKNVEITEISRPIVSGRYTNQVVSLSDDGLLKIDGVITMNYDQATMNVIRSLKLDLSTLRVKSNNGKGYLTHAGELLSCILGAALKKTF